MLTLTRHYCDVALFRETGSTWSLCSGRKRAHFSTDSKRGNTTLAHAISFPRIHNLLLSCVVFTLNRSFYPASSAHPVPVLIPYPGEIVVLWAQIERQRNTENQNYRKFMGKASAMSAYWVENARQAKPQNKKKKHEMRHNTNDTITGDPS